MTKSKAAWILLAFGLASCGKVGDLEPRAGKNLPPKAYGQKTEQTAEALTTPSAQARPGRSDELRKRSERRDDDPFDVPPGKEPKPFDAQKTADETKPKPS
jgi:predicted small lipoprotein YifL